MAAQKEIRVGSIAQVYAYSGAPTTAGIVLAKLRPARAKLRPLRAPPSVEIYWFKGKYITWEYIDCLEVLVY